MYYYFIEKDDMGQFSDEAKSRIANSMAEILVNLFVAANLKKIDVAINKGRKSTNQNIENDLTWAHHPESYCIKLLATVAWRRAVVLEESLISL